MCRVSGGPEKRRRLADYDPWFLVLMHYTREELGELGAFALTVAVGLGIGLAASSVWIGIAAGVVTCVLAFGLLKADEKHGDGTITTILVIVGFTAMLIHLVRSVAHLL